MLNYNFINYSCLDQGWNFSLPAIKRSTYRNNIATIKCTFICTVHMALKRFEMALALTFSLSLSFSLSLMCLSGFLLLCCFFFFFCSLFFLLSLFHSSCSVTRFSVFYVSLAWNTQLLHQPKSEESLKKEEINQHIHNTLRTLKRIPIWIALHSIQWECTKCNTVTRRPCD